MSFRLLPKDPKFFELFIADGDNLEAAAGALNEMVDQYDRLESRVANIQALEKRGDEIDREVTRRLEDAFVTPFDREDIHELVSRLDDVVDGIQAIAETFVIYGVAAPTPEARRFGSSMGSRGSNPTSMRSTSSRTRRTACHVRRSPGSSTTTCRPSRSSSGGTCTTTSRRRSTPPRMPPRRWSGCTTRPTDGFGGQAGRRKT
jgi:hypothetical protein